MKQLLMLLMIVAVCVYIPRYVISPDDLENDSSQEDDWDDDEVAVARFSSFGYVEYESLVYHPWPKSPSPWEE